MRQIVIAVGNQVGQERDLASEREFERAVVVVVVMVMSRSLEMQIVSELEIHGLLLARLGEIGQISDRRLIRLCCLLGNVARDVRRDHEEDDDDEPS